MRFLLVLFLNFLLLSTASAGYRSAESVYNSKKYRKSTMARKIVIELVSDKFYFAAIPWMKEYLISSNKKLDGEIERAFDRILTNAGTGQFELLPIKFLKRSSSNSIRYLIAKKYLRQNKAANAIAYASKINPNHPVYPFAANLLGTAYSIKGNQRASISNFKDCERISDVRAKKERSKMGKRQLLMNRDYCIMGIARAQFTKKDYKTADLTYLDIPKSSFVWPEVLFEEAWNSYYLKNYNRTLGKLVSYKAPVFDYIFTPEIDVLNALTYLKLCLYSDAKKISDDFYNQYMKPARALRLFLKRKGKNYKYFYRLMLDFEKTKRSNSILMSRMLKSIKRDGAYYDLKNGLGTIANELTVLGRKRNSRFRRVTTGNLKEALRTQRKLMGSYVRNGLVGKYAELFRAFEGMSYIKLEVLAQRKARLYNFDDKKRSRGDVKYIEKNEKQYFWDFNGEFWADELGDYVFALGSEC